jgi:hypothetical protein
MFREVGSCVALVAILLAVTAWGEEPKGANLPLKQVVLFSSGVGFFENAGKVENDAKVEMKFKVDQINDLLKSMVVEDLDGGQVSTVNYGSKDPIRRAKSKRPVGKSFPWATRWPNCKNHSTNTSWHSTCNNRPIRAPVGRRLGAKDDARAGPAAQVSLGGTRSVGRIGFPRGPAPSPPFCPLACMGN